MKHDSNPRIRLLLADVYLRMYKWVYISMWYTNNDHLCCSVDAARKVYNDILAGENKEHQKEAFAGLGIINYITVRSD